MFLKTCNSVIKLSMVAVQSSYPFDDLRPAPLFCQCLFRPLQELVEKARHELECNSPSPGSAEKPHESACQLEATAAVRHDPVSDVHLSAETAPLGKVLPSPVLDPPVACAPDLSAEHPLTLHEDLPSPILQAPMVVETVACSDSIAPASSDQVATTDLVQSLELNSEQRARLKHFETKCASSQGNKGGRTWGLATTCCICAREKHSCKWALKDDGIVYGSWCRACIRASELLRCTKKMDVLMACPDVKDVLRRKSDSLVKKMPQQDECTCKVCKPRPSKKSEKDQISAESISQVVTALRVREVLWSPQSRLRKKTSCSQTQP